jgi:hypothetical protein
MKRPTTSSWQSTRRPDGPTITTISVLRSVEPVTLRTPRTPSKGRPRSIEATPDLRQSWTSWSFGKRRARDPRRSSKCEGSRRPRPVGRTHACWLFHSLTGSLSRSYPRMEQSDLAASRRLLHVAPSGDVRCTTALAPKAEVHPRSCDVAEVPAADLNCSAATKHIVRGRPNSPLEAAPHSWSSAAVVSSATCFEIPKSLNPSTADYFLPVCDATRFLWKADRSQSINAPMRGSSMSAGGYSARMSGSNA